MNNLRYKSSQALVLEFFLFIKQVLAYIFGLSVLCLLHGQLSVSKFY